MITPVHRALAGAVVGFAALGCSTTTAIRPDQLPILTNAADPVGREPTVVIDASGQRVRMDDTLEAVEVTSGPEPGEVTTFHAPVASAVRGSTLVVRDDEKTDSFPLNSIQGVKVTYADNGAKLTGGVMLDILGGLCIVGGPAYIVGAVWADRHSRTESFATSFTAVLIGVPLALVVGPAMLIPGILLTRSATRKPKPPQRPISAVSPVGGPRARVKAGPGGFRVSF